MWSSTADLQKDCGATSGEVESVALDGLAGDAPAMLASSLRDLLDSSAKVRIDGQTLAPARNNVREESVSLCPHRNMGGRCVQSLVMLGLRCRTCIEPRMRGWFQKSVFKLHACVSTAIHRRPTKWAVHFMVDPHVVVLA